MNKERRARIQALQSQTVEMIEELKNLAEEAQTTTQEASRLLAEHEKHCRPRGDRAKKWGGNR